MCPKMFMMCVMAWLGATGCAAPVLTAAELEYHHVIDRENWTMCKMAYRQAGKHMIHMDNRGETVDQISTRVISHDLVLNQCSRVLGDYWAGY